MNAHFYSGHFFLKTGEGEYTEHYGETREERIHQFHEENETPVLGYAEGYILRCYGKRVELLGGPTLQGGALTIFRKGHPPLEVEGLGGQDLSVLFRDPSDGLIPLPVIFGNPVKTQARISPDGRYLSYLAPSDDQVRRRARPQIPQPLIPTRITPTPDPKFPNPP